VSKDYPVVALVLGTTEVVSSLTKNLRYFTDGTEACYDLFEGVEAEVNWSEVKIDTPVWCRLTGRWWKRHFAGLDKHGIPQLGWTVTQVTRQIAEIHGRKCA
jgi:hypothetical protein